MVFSTGDSKDVVGVGVIFVCVFSFSNLQKLLIMNAVDGCFRI